MKGTRWRVFIAAVLAITFLVNFSFPSIGLGKGNGDHQYQVSRDKKVSAHAAAWAKFQQDSLVESLISEAIGEGHSFKLDSPAFIDVGSGIGGNWTAVAVAGTRRSKESILITGYYNSATDEVEYAGVLVIKEGNSTKEKVRLESKRYDHGKLVREVGATYDSMVGLWHDDAGKVLQNPEAQISSTVTFGAKASAICYYDFVCNMFYGTVAVLICALVGSRVTGPTVGRKGASITQPFWKSALTILAMFVVFQIAARVSVAVWDWGKVGQVAFGMGLAALTGVLVARRLNGK